MPSLKQLYEARLGNLERDTIRGFPDTKKRQHITGTVNISNIEYIPYVESNTIEIKAIARTSGGTYNPSILVNDVEFQDTDAPNTATFQANDQQYHVTPISKNLHDCSVSCDCADFRWRFAMTNFADGSLIGSPPPTYIRKTTTRPPVNPLNVIGLCKHLTKFVETLEGVGLITP